MLILLIIAGVIAVVVLFLAVLTVVHQTRSSSEYKRLEAPGEVVEVAGHKMHVYLEGEHANENAPLLVFLVGSSDPFPVFTFRPLYPKLSKTHRIALVERPGFGYSEETNQPRDIDRILSETRTALSLVGEGDRQYILLPHSAAGLEALYWAHRYPNEIAGILGLDMAVPQAVSASKINPFVLKLVKLLAFIGVHRLSGVAMMNGIVDLSAIEKDLSVQDREQMKLLFNTTMYKNVDKETPEYLKAAQLIEEQGILNKPMILFYSGKFEMMGSKPGSWLKHKKQFALEHNVPLIHIDAGHLLMSEKPELIAQQAYDFMAAL